MSPPLYVFRVSVKGDEMELYVYVLRLWIRLGFGLGPGQMLRGGKCPRFAAASPLLIRCRSETEEQQGLATEAVV